MKRKNKKDGPAVVVRDRKPAAVILDMTNTACYSSASKTPAPALRRN